MTLRWFGISACTATPEDLPPSLAQHGWCWRSSTSSSLSFQDTPGIRLNPFDLSPGPEALTRRALFVHTLIAVLLREKPDPAATAALDRGIICAYEAAGITADPRSHTRPAPLLADLAAALGADGDPAARTLSARLAPFVTGTHRGLFDGPTTTQPHGHLVVFSLRDLPDELKVPGRCSPWTPSGGG